MEPKKPQNSAIFAQIAQDQNRSPEMEAVLIELARELLQFQPEATNIMDSGDCPHCRYGKMLFYQLPEYDSDMIDDTGRLSGGFYCPRCSWSMSGKYKVREQK